MFPQMSFCALHRPTLLLVAGVLLASCRTGFGGQPKATGAVSVQPSGSPTTEIVAQGPFILPGRVVDAAGDPLAGVPVLAWPVGILPPDSRASLVANDAAGLIANNAAGLVANDAAGRRTLQLAVARAMTDASGSFRLEVPEGRYNLEAVHAINVKAWMANVPAGPLRSGETVLRALPTGRITGRVAMPAPSAGAGAPVFVTETEILVAGSGYKARPDASGSFLIEHVPAGIFQPIVWHPILGAAKPWGEMVEVPATSEGLFLPDIRPSVEGGWVAIPSSVTTGRPKPSPSPTGTVPIPEPTGTPAPSSAPSASPAASPTPAPAVSPTPTATPAPTPAPTQAPATQRPGVFFIDGSLPHALQRAGHLTLDREAMAAVGLDPAMPRHLLLGGVTSQNVGSRQATDSVMLITEDDQGRLDAFRMLDSRLRVPRHSPGVVFLPPYVYVIGGMADAEASTPLASVERAILTSDGLGAFEMAGDLLDAPKGCIALAQVGNWLFSIGGKTGPREQDFSADIVRAVINKDGTIGPFQPHATLLQERCAGILAGPRAKRFFLLGGSGADTNGQIRLADVERLDFTDSRSLDTPVNMTSAPDGARANVLPAPRTRFSHAVLGDFLYVFGGWTGMNGTEILRAALNDGGLGDFSEVAGPRLAVGVEDAATIVTGRNLYLLGGANTDSPSGVSFIQRAPLLDQP